MAGDYRLMISRDRFGPQPVFLAMRDYYSYFELLLLDMPMLLATTTLLRFRAAGHAAGSRRTLISMSTGAASRAACLSPCASGTRPASPRTSAIAEAPLLRCARRAFSPKHLLASVTPHVYDSIQFDITAD